MQSGVIDAVDKFVDVAVKVVFLPVGFCDVLENAIPGFLQCGFVVDNCFGRFKVRPENEMKMRMPTVFPPCIFGDTYKMFDVFEKFVDRFGELVKFFFAQRFAVVESFPSFIENIGYFVT